MIIYLYIFSITHNNMKIILIRHGKPKIVNGDFFGCHLGEEGISKTQELGESGKIVRPDIIFSSPYNRAIDTAKVFAKLFKQDFVVSEDLKEWNLQAMNLHME